MAPIGPRHGTAVMRLGRRPVHGTGDAALRTGRGRRVRSRRGRGDAAGRRTGRRRRSAPSRPAARPMPSGTAHLNAPAAVPITPPQPISPMHAARPPSLAPATAAALLLAVLAGAFASRAAAFTGDALSLFWPPAGIAFAAAQALGAGALWPVAAGVAIWAAATYGTDSVIVPFAVAASTLGPLAGVRAERALLAWRHARGRPTAALHRLLAFYAAAGFVAAPIAALVGTAGMRLDGQYLDHPPVAVAAGYWLVDCLGLLLFAPAVAASLSAPRGARRPRFDAPTLIASAALAAAGVALIAHGQSGYARVLSFLFLPLVAFCAVRRGARTSHWTLVACAVTLLTLHAFGQAAETGTTGRELALFSDVLAVFAAIGLAQVLQAVSTDRRAALEAVAKAAREDPATGLLNQRGLDEALDARLGDASLDALGVVGVRLRNLEAASDLLDPAAAARIVDGIGRTLARQPGLLALARPEPTRFVALCAAGDRTVLEARAQALLAELQAVRIAAGSVTMRLAPSIGAVFARPRTGLQADTMRVALREAEIDAGLRIERALVTTTLEGGVLESHLTRLRTTERVREAILSRRLKLMAQPLAANRPERALAGHDVEVLVRLVDAAGTLIPPAEFLPAIAAADLAIDLDRAVVSGVFDWFVAHPQALARTAKCAINLSATSLSDPAFTEFVARALASRGLPARRLAFEITESSALLDPTRAADTLARLREMGFRVALDDFGTGLCTFDYLKKLPIDYVKIDGSFVRDLGHDDVDAEIVASIVRVAARRGVRTVAEYVSTEVLRRRVTELGVDYSQGWAIGEPVPIEEALATATGDAAVPAAAA